MKRAAFALICLLLVLGAAALRPRLSPPPQPLLTAPRGVVLVAVEGLGVRDAGLIFRQANFSGYGLMPTRNGTPDDGDFDAGMRMILSGTRTPASGGADVIAIARRYRAPLDVRTFTGTGALNSATTAPSSLTAPGGTPEGTAVLIFGVTPSVADLRRRERVAPVFYWTPRSGNADTLLLTSPSTRHRPGLIAATDVAATVAAMLEVPRHTRRIGDGRPIEGVAIESAVNEPISAEHPAVRLLHSQAEGWSQQAREQKLLSALPWCLAALLLATVLTRHARIRAGLRAVALSTPLSLVIVATMLPSPRAAYFVYCVAALPVLCLGVTALSRESWGERIPRLLAITTAFTIALDTCFGGYFLSKTPLSYSVLEAARFYGIGNEVSGLFLGAALIGVGGKGSDHFATVFWGLASALLLGAPSLGADAGGFIAASVGFVTLFLVNRRGEPNLSRTAAKFLLPCGIALFLILAAFALWDGSRSSSSRSHVGQAVSLAREKGFASIAEIAERKARVNLRLLASSPWAVLLATEVGLLIWMYRERKRREQCVPAPAPAAIRTALITTMVTLFALNDSGVVAGATCGCWILGVEDWGAPSGRSLDRIPEDAAPANLDQKR